MIGNKQFEIDATEFIKGMSTSPNTNDGGFSNETIAINPIASVGAMYGGSAITDRSTNTINGNIIMTSGDATYTGAQKFLGTDTGYFYSVDSSYSPTARQSAVAGTYVSGYSDMVQFAYGGNAYTFVSTTTDIVRMTGSTLTGLDATWWTSTLGMTALGVNPIGGATGVTTAHPLLVFEDALWIGDFNKLHKWDGTTASYGFLTLPQDQTIVALGIDPNTGKMLISTTQGANASDTVPKICKILVWDGFSTRVLRSVVVDDMVTAIYPVGGTVYMPYGVNLGYWNGSGVTFLRKLKNASLDSNLLVYKPKITNIGNTLYVMDGTQILAYGQIQAGENKFYYANKATGATLTYLTALFNLGSNQLGMGYYDGTNKILASYDIYSTTIINNIKYFYSSNYNFLRRVQVRQIIVEYVDAIAASGSGGVLTLIDQTGTEYTCSSLTNTKTASVKEITCQPPAINPASTYIQLKYEPVSAKGVRRFIVSYDYIE